MGKKASMHSQEGAAGRDLAAGAGALEAVLLAAALLAAVIADVQREVALRELLAGGQVVQRPELHLLWAGTAQKHAQLRRMPPADDCLPSRQFTCVCSSRTCNAHANLQDPVTSALRNRSVLWSDESIQSSHAEASLQAKRQRDARRCCEGLRGRGSRSCQSVPH